MNETNEPTILVEVPCHCCISQEIDCRQCDGAKTELLSLPLSAGLPLRYSFRGLLARINAQITVSWKVYCEDRKRLNCLHITSDIDVPDIISGEQITVGQTKHIPLRALSKKRPTNLDEEIRREFKRLLAHEVDESFLVEGYSCDPHGLEND